MNTSLPKKQGLYDPWFEHDACGVGVVANIKGKKSNKILRQALVVLHNMDHRGGHDTPAGGHSAAAGAGHGAMNHGAMNHGAMSGMQHGDHGAAANDLTKPSTTVRHARTEWGPGTDMRVDMPRTNLDDPGVGLRNNGRRVLTYADLRSTFIDPDGREPGRTIELHLTGHMEKFAWSFDGIKFSDAEPLRLKYGERLRITLVNDTMMTHPIHLHGMWSDLEDENGNFMVRKHTIDMPPGSKRSYRVTADALGRWAYHCHLLFHMEMGMFREVRVDE